MRFLSSQFTKSKNTLDSERSRREGDRRTRRRILLDHLRNYRRPNLEPLEDRRLLAATPLHWQGDSDSNWSNPANWDQNVAPVNGDVLVFKTDTAGFVPAGFTSHNDMVNLDNIVLRIEDNSAVGKFIITGNQVNLNSSATLQHVQSVSGQPTELHLPLQLGGDVDVVSGTLHLYGPLTGTGIAKAGAGSLTIFSNANAYTGNTEIQGGYLHLGNAGTIPDTSDVVISAGATVDLNGYSESFDVLSGAGTLISSAGSPTSFGVGADNGSGTFSGVISQGIYGQLSVSKLGTGTWGLSNASNDYGGTTTIVDGTLNLEAAEVIPDASQIHFVNAGSTLDLHDSGTETIAGLSSVGSVGQIVHSSSGLIGAHTLELSLSAPSTLSFGGQITDDGVSLVELRKSGAGTQYLTGNNSFSALTVNEGRLSVNGTLSGTGGNVAVNSGGVLGGTGAINRPVVSNSGATVAPGDSPGTLVTGNLTLGGDYQVELGGTTPGDVSGTHDQLVVNGTVSISAGTTLSVLSEAGFVPSAGDQFTIVDNDASDAVSGVFEDSGGGDWSNGEIFSLDFLGSGLLARVWYDGGDGNDVVLEVLDRDIKINEVDFDQPGTVDDEQFIELFNNGSSAIDISGFTVDFFDSAGAQIAGAAVTIPAATTLAAGDYYVIAVTGTTVSNVDQYVPSFSASVLGPVAVSLFDSDGVPYDSLAIKQAITGQGEFVGSGFADLVENNTDDRSIGRLFDGYDLDKNYVDFVFMPPTPGAANASVVIAGAVSGQTISDAATVNPFSTMSLIDDDNSDLLNVQVTVSDYYVNGGLTNLGGFAHVSPGVFTLTGQTAAAATTALNGLTFVPTQNQVTYPNTVTTTFSVDVTSQRSKLIPVATAMFSHSGLDGFHPNGIANGDIGGTAWHTDASTAGAYLQLDLGAGNERVINRHRSHTSTAYAGVFDIQYSDDASSWTTAYSAYTPNVANDWNEVTWSQSTAHRYWRLLLTNTPGSGSWITESEFYETASDTSSDDTTSVIATPDELDQYEWDTSFGTGGHVALNVDGSNFDQIFDTAVQADGKIVAVGETSYSGGEDFAIVRYNTDGSLDSGFGTGGRVVLDFSGGDDSARSVAVQPDGKIVVAGYGGASDMAVARLNMDGSLDTTFDGPSGSANGSFSLPYGASDFAYDMALESDGQIVLVGFVYNSGKQNFAVVRLNSDGSYDQDFDGDSGSADGRVILDIEPGQHSVSNAVAIQADGKIVVAGYANQSVGGDNFVVVRLADDGALDSGFGSSGEVVEDFNGAADRAQTVAVRPTGEIVVGGYADFAYERFALMQLTSAGALDPNFDGDSGTGNGKVHFSVGSYDSRIQDLEIDASGRLVLAGFSNPTTSSTTGSWAIARTNSIGQLDSSFDVDGKYVHDFSSREEEARAIALDSAGSIIVGGFAGRQTAGGEDLVLTKLNPVNGALDTAFDFDGIVQTDFVGPNDDSGRDVLVQPDGKIVVVGYSAPAADGLWSIHTADDIVVARFMPDGSPDLGFGTNGIVNIDVSGRRDQAEGIALQADGKIVIVGLSLSDGDRSTSDFLIVRLNSDGSLDSSFDGPSGTADGKVLLDFDGDEDQAFDVIVLPNQQLLVGGTSDSGYSNGGDNFAIAKLNTDGSLDTTFDGDSGTGNGQVYVDVAGSSDFAEALAVQADGKILLAGRSYQSGSHYDFALVRFNSDGTLDTNFDGDSGTADGKVLLSLVGAADGAYGVDVTGAGEIFVAGYADFGSGATRHDVAVVKLDSLGQLVTAFDTDGIVTVDVDGQSDQGRDIIVNADGTVLVAGYGNENYSGGYDNFAVMRLLANGALDTSFDAADGMHLLDIDGSADRAYGLAKAPDDSLLVVGDMAVYATGADELALARLHVVQPPQLKINEVDYAQDGGDTAEFIELFNDDSVALSLGGYKLEHYNSSGTLTHTENLSGTVAAGDYFVVGMSGVANVDQTSAYAIPGGDWAVSLFDDQGTLLDSVAFAAGVAGKGEGNPAPFEDTPPDGSIGRAGDGFDTDDNLTDFVRMASTPGAVNLFSVSYAGTGGADSFSLALSSGGDTVELRLGGSLVGSYSAESLQSLALTGDAGDDVLTIDTSHGNPIPAGGLTFHAGSHTSGDSIVVIGSGAAVVHDLTGTDGTSGDGAIDWDGRVLTYTGLEPVDLTGSTITDLTINVDPLNSVAGAVTTTIDVDSGTNTLVSHDNGLESTLIGAITGTLTVNGDVGDDDTFNLDGLGSNFAASLIVDTKVGSDLVKVQGTLSLSTGKSLSITSYDVAVLGTGNVSTTGSGSITVDAIRMISTSSGASLTTVDGGITLHGNQQAIPSSGNFDGVYISGSTLQTTGTGSIELRGRGGDEAGASYQDGVTVSLSNISSTATGPSAGGITIVGTGGTGTSSNTGVYLYGDGSDIQSVDGDVSISGTGGTASGGENYGIRVQYFGIESSGTGPDAATITLDGTGGSGTTANIGIRFQHNATSHITSTDGDIQIIGAGGSGTTSGMSGIYASGGGEIVSQGTGPDAATITVSGTGGTGASYNRGILLLTDERIASVDGDILIDGTGGGDGTGAYNAGLLLQSIDEIKSSGTGPHAATITLLGTGGLGTDRNGGIAMTGAASLISSTDGDILIDGEGGNSSTHSNIGVEIVDSTVESLGTGVDAASVTIVGDGGTGTTNNHGIQLNGSSPSISAVNGNVDLTGTGGGNSGAGVVAYNGTVQATSGSNNATGSITINGTATGSVASIQFQGDIASDLGAVALSADSWLYGFNGTIQSDSGTVSLTADVAVGNNGGHLGLGNMLIDAGAGDIELQSDGKIDVSQLITTGEVRATSTSSELVDAIVGETTVNITAASLAVQTATGVGRSDDINTSISSLAIRNTTSGAVNIENTLGSSLTIGTVDGVVGVNNAAAGQTVTITTPNDLSVDAPVITTGGALGLIADGDITVSQPVTTSGGSLTLTADADANGAGTLSVLGASGGSPAQIKKIYATDPSSYDVVGRAVALRGDIAAVSNSQDDDDGSNSGSVMILSRNHGGADNWGHLVEVTASDAAASDRFGHSVTLGGNLLAVGSKWATKGGVSQSGQAYVFSQNQGGADNWGEVAILSPSDPAVNKLFGQSISVDTEHVVVGANGDSQLGTLAGAAYVFNKDQGGVDNWGQVKKLNASDGSSHDQFGTSSAVSGDTIVVGASGAGTNSDGAAYVFQRHAGGSDNWGQVKKLELAPTTNPNKFGESVAILGDVIAIGTPGDWEGTSGTSYGGVYLYGRDVGGVDNWGLIKRVTAQDKAHQDKFGISVSLDGDRLIVGATEDDDKGSETGAVYLFDRNAGGTDNWGQIAKYVPADSETDDEVGLSVAVSGETVLFGSYMDDDLATNSGAAYLFETPSSVNGSLDSGTGAMSLTAVDVNLTADVSGSATLTIKPSVSGSSIGLGGGPGSLNLSDTELAHLVDGFLSLTIGDTASGTGQVRINSTTFTDPVTIAGGQLNDNTGVDITAPSVTLDGDVSPGQSPGILSAAGDFSFAANDTFSVEIGGTTPGDGPGFHDQLSVDGTVTIGVGTTLNPSLFGGYAIATGDSIVIIDNDASDAIVGKFDDGVGGTWDEGEVIDANIFGTGLRAQISYVAGDGNDVGLSFTATDYGDAPAPYPTLLTNSGASHDIVSGFSLGSDVDGESDGQPLAGALGDDQVGSPDDEDGVTQVGGGALLITDTLARGNTSEMLDVVVTNTAGVADPYLDAWIDFNQDGDWDDVGEHVLSQAVTAGTNTVTFAIPDDALLGETAARFRLHSATGPGLAPTGFAPVGEVEDHAVHISFDVSNPDQVAKLLASDGANSDYFGFAVDISGDTAVVGAYGDDDEGTYTGSAYVYVLDGGVWTQQAKLSASDEADSSEFGYAVAIDGDTIAVGAHVEDDGGNSNNGAVYVYTRSGSLWAEQQKLLASDTATGDRFGNAVDIDGDRLIVGAHLHHEESATATTDNGAAYIFTRSGGTWTEHTKLVASDRGDGDQFGSSVAIDGDVAAIGARYWDGASGDTGAVYVFTLSGGTWSEQQILQASDAGPSDALGFSVDIDDDLIVSGAYYDDDVATNSGAAYVFVLDGTTWVEQDKLLPNTTTARYFGRDVAVSGQIVAVGSEYETYFETRAGATYVFSRAGTDWQLADKVAAGQPSLNGYFGIGVGLDGTRLLSGAHTQNSNGAAFVHELEVGEQDFGDAPATYPVLEADDGARHTYSGLRLGTRFDEDFDGAPSADAMGDDLDEYYDDEDGVTFASPLIAGLGATVSVEVSDSSSHPNPYLDAWIDFNRDGDWDDAGEHVISQGVIVGTNDILISVPASALLGDTYSRFRLHSATGPGLLPTGAASVGEVEDHVVTVTFDHDQIANLIGSDSLSGDSFGYSVAMDGDTAVVGAYGNDELGSRAGAAYVFVHDASNRWVEQAKLTASDAAIDDFFGYSVAISGDSVVVGAYREDDGSTTNNTGAAYVFTRSGSIWTEQDKLTASDASDNDEFGSSVAIDGDSVVVGALYGDDGGTADTGAAYVFTRSGSSWSEQAKLNASDSSASDRFGHAVAIDGDTVILGAYGEDDGNTSSNGAAYVYTRSGTAWSEQAKLLAGDRKTNDYLGWSVDVDGDTAIVGARNADTEVLSNTGAAYVFERAGTVWTQHSKLTASTPVSNGSLGSSVAIEGDRAVAGSYGGVGSVVVFQRTGGRWSELTEMVAGDSPGGEQLGYSVALSGNRVVGGAPVGLIPGGVSNTGEAIIFDLQTTEDYGDAPEPYPVLLADDGARHSRVYGFSLGATVDTERDGKPDPNAARDDLWYDDEDGVVFTSELLPGLDAGVDVTVTMDHTQVPDPYLDAWIDFNQDGDWDDAGERVISQAVTVGTNSFVISVPTTAVYGSTFSRFRLHSATGPGLLPTGSASEGEVEDHPVIVTFDTDQIAALYGGSGSSIFGYVVSVDGNTAAVGAYADDSLTTDAGAVHVYTRQPNNTWQLQQKLIASDGASSDHFGFSVDLDGDTLVVGARYNDQVTTNAGAAYVFVRDADSWTEQQKLVDAAGASYDQFGHSVAVDGDSLIVGAHQRDAGAVTDSGAAFIYTRSAGVWSLQQEISASTKDSSDLFGEAVDIDGDSVVIGASFDDGATVSNSGAAYVFTRSGAMWTEQQRLVAPKEGANDYFGRSVSIDGDRVLIGAHGADSQGIVDSGAAHLFERSGVTWTHQDQLVAADAQVGDVFGYSVDLQGARLIVGAVNADYDGNSNVGSAYLFSRSSTNHTWAQQGHFVDTSPRSGSYMGRSVSVSGNTVVVGANNGGANYEGEVFIFDLETTIDYGDAPEDYPVLLADDGARHTKVYGFGLGPTVDTEFDGKPSADAGRDDLWVDDEDGVTWPDALRPGDTHVEVEVDVHNISGISNPYLDAWIDFNQDNSWDVSERIASQPVVAGSNTLVFAIPDSASYGQTYARFRLRSATTPGLPTGAATEGEVEDYAVTLTDNANISTILSNDQDGSQFGYAIAIEGNTAVIGDPQYNGGQGRAYIYERDGQGNWNWKSTLNNGSGQFGYSVAIYGDTIAVGAPTQYVTYSGAGAVHFYTESGGNWSYRTYIYSPARYYNLNFGRSIALAQDAIFVGEPLDDFSGNDDRGNVYLFTGSGSSWTYRQTLQSSLSGARYAGSALAVDNGHLVVGAPGSDTAYVFEQASPTSWTYRTTLTGEVTGDNFGVSVDIDENTVAVGATYREEVPHTSSGAVYVYTGSGAAWSRQQKLIASDLDSYDYFGSAVDVEGDRLMVGANGADEDSWPYSGSAYLFTRASNSWSQESKLVPRNNVRLEQAGTSVAIAGGTYLLGAPYNLGGRVHEMVPPYDYDFGDLPDTYLTEYDDNGARHVATGPRLGALRDIEIDGPPTTDAGGDNSYTSADEDGVTFGSLTPGLYGASITLDVQNAAYAYADAWIDFNGDGTFTNDERILDNVGVVAGLNTLPIDVAASAMTGNAYARVRLSSEGNLEPYGIAYDGEVEDYQVNILDSLLLNLPATSNDITIRDNAGNLEVYDNSASSVLLSRSLMDSYSLTINGSATATDSIHVDYDFGGFFSLPGGIHLTGGGNTGDSLSVKGTGSTQLDYSMLINPIGQTQLVATQGTEATHIRYDDFEDLSFESLLTFDAHSVLNVGAHSVSIDSVVPVDLSSLTLIDTGTLTVNSLALGAGKSITGRGTVAGRVSAEVGSLIHLTGDLTVGDSASTSGFITRGDVQVGEHTLNLLDANQAVLGSHTALGSASVSGTIVAANGLLVDFGNNLTGYGTIDTNTTVASPMIINGAVDGASGAQPITFDGGYIKGVGTLDDFVLSGGAVNSPGFSPAAVYYGSGVYASDSSTLIELGGTTPGSSGHDQINHSGTATLGGTLDVQLINGFTPSVGDSFVILTSSGGIIGTFDSEQLPAAPLGSGWNVVYGSTEVRIELIDLANVDSVQFGNGTNQHSRIEEIVVTFEGQVDIDSDAFTVLKRGTGGGTVGNSFGTALDSSGNTVATITFSGAFTRDGGALLDGYYQLTIDGSKVRRFGTQLTLDGDNDGLQGGAFNRGEQETDDFFALYADTNGDGLVGIAEFGQFRAAFGKTPTQTGYNELFDYDGLGVGISDFGQFRARFGKPKLPFE